MEVAVAVAVADADHSCSLSLSLISRMWVLKYSNTTRCLSLSHGYVDCPILMCQPATVSFELPPPVGTSLHLQPTHGDGDTARLTS